MASVSTKMRGANWGAITFYMKCGIAAWSLLVLALDAAFIAKWNQYFNRYAGFYYGGSFPSANAVIACCIFNMLLFGAMIYFIKFRPESIFISMIVDTCIIGFLFLFNIGSVGGFTTIATVVWDYGGDRDSWWSIGSAVVALGWIMVVAILALLIIEVTIVLMHHGTSLDIWKTPFNILVAGGSTRSAGPASTAHEDLEAKFTPAPAPTMTSPTGPQV